MRLRTNNRILAFIVVLTVVGQSIAYAKEPQKKVKRTFDDYMNLSQAIYENLDIPESSSCGKGYPTDCAFKLVGSLLCIKGSHIKGKGGYDCKYIETTSWSSKQVSGHDDQYCLAAVFEKLKIPSTEKKSSSNVVFSEKKTEGEVTRTITVNNKIFSVTQANLTASRKIGFSSKFSSIYTQADFDIDEQKRAGTYGLNSHGGDPGDYLIDPTQEKYKVGDVFGGQRYPSVNVKENPYETDCDRASMCKAVLNYMPEDTTPVVFDNIGLLRGDFTPYVSREAIKASSYCKDTFSSETNGNEMSTQVTTVKPNPAGNNNPVQQDESNKATQVK